MQTVAALVATYGDGLRVLAGGSGGQRLVTWAHAVDLPDPWSWVAAGDLVMTTGAGMPAAAAEQAAWLDRLADAEVSAVVIAPRPDAAAITPALLAVADRRRLPVLSAGFELEFAQLARTVIEAALRAQRERLSASQRMFEAYAAASRQEKDFQGRLSSLGHRLGWRITVLASRDGRVLAQSRPGEHDTASLTAQIPGRDSAVVRVSRLQPASHAVTDGLDPLIVSFLAGLIGVELEGRAITRDEQRVDGEKTLVDLLTGALDLAATQPLLQRRGLAGALVVLVLRPADGSRGALAELHHAPTLLGRAPLMLIDKDGALVAVVPDEPGMIEGVVQAAGGGSVGISATITAGTPVSEAVRQARLALHHACERGERIHRYATGSALGLTPTTVPQARALVEQHLGAVLHHDAEHGSDLLHTLETFLVLDGRARETADALHIHRQTLVYRLAVVERLSGVKPSSTAGTAAFWVAFQAGRAADVLPGTRP